jgi:hypothetical protein
VRLKGGVAAFVLFSACCVPLRGQQADSVLLKNDRYIAELDSMLTAGDTLRLFSLIDSLLNLPEISVRSQIMLRLGYNSNVVSASRTLGFNQFGLAPGLAYYHKSGLYVDATSYWSTQYDPNLYLTVASAGYLKSPTSWWSFIAEYSRFIYTHQSELAYVAYTNSAGISNFFDVKKFTFRFDYQFYFGDKQAHRIIPSVMYNLEKKNIGKIKRLSFFPTVSLMTGTEQITEIKPYARTLAGIIWRQRNGLPLFYEETRTEFGVLNYSFVAPVSLTISDWFFMLSYTYNIPKALPGEAITLTNSGYLSATVSKRIEFKPKARHTPSK